ncbi:MAG: GH32 C-terminal domain-containing protein, partial [Bacteroidota bacterium]
DFNPEWNVYEIKFSMRVARTNQTFTVDLANNGEGNYLTLGFDSETSRIFIDRSKMRNNFSHPAYNSIMYAPIKISEDSILDFHVFVDQSSIEVFANDYKTVLSALAFSKPSATGITMRSEGTSTDLISLKAYNLNSIWDVQPSEIINNTTEIIGNNDTPKLFPNPVSGGDIITLQWKNPVKISEGKLSLIAMNGQEVHKVLLNKIETDNIILDIPEFYLSNGLYILQLHSENINFTKKIIIQ